MELIKRDQKKIAISVVQFNGIVEISIDDNGSGIQSGSESKIFELSVSSKLTGSGIGLWLCKNIVSRYLASITAMTSPLGGAYFKIRIPALN